MWPGNPRGSSSTEPLIRESRCFAGSRRQSACRLPNSLSIPSQPGSRKSRRSELRYSPSLSVTERQCVTKPILRHDAGNEYSVLAVQVLRTNGEQLGHAPEYLAERIHEEEEAGYKTIGVLKDLTGGSREIPTHGANFVVFFLPRDMTNNELQQYAIGVFASHGAGRPGQLDLALSSSSCEESSDVLARFHPRSFDLPHFPSPTPSTCKAW